MKAVRDIDHKMEQASIWYYAALEYVRIQKGRGFVYAVGNQLYTRVKTEGYRAARYYSTIELALVLEDEMMMKET